MMARSDQAHEVGFGAVLILAGRGGPFDAQRLQQLEASDSELFVLVALPVMVRNRAIFFVVEDSR